MCILYCFLLLLFSYQIADAGVLLQPSDLTYVGSFRVPQGNLGGDSSRWTMGRGGHGATYNPVRNSLVMLGSNAERVAVEISIPTLLGLDTYTRQSSQYLTKLRLSGLFPSS